MAAFMFALALMFRFVNNSYAVCLAIFATAAYVLYKEEDLWLKHCVVKAIVVMISFMFVPFFIDLIDKDIFKFLNFFLQFADVEIMDKFKIFEFIQAIFNVFEKIILLLLTFGALKGKSIKIPFIDNMISKHLQ